MKGWVYVITTKSMPSLLKVGFSRKDPEIRALELNNTGNPYPYAVEYDVLVNDPASIEKKAHVLLNAYHENKEWFKCSIDVAIEAILESAKGSVLLETNKNHSKNYLKTDDAKFSLNEGMAFDRSTGLTWLRFCHGQCWHDSRLYGQREGLSWNKIYEIIADFNNEGGYAGNSDWRLPDINELMTLVVKKKRIDTHAIDVEIFPENDKTNYIVNHTFWSSSFVTLPRTAARSGDFVRTIDFLTGQKQISRYKSQGIKYAVRLVRGTMRSQAVTS